MTESTDSNFTATLKAAAGYDAPWLVIRGATAAEVVQRLSEAESTALLAATAQTARVFAQSWNDPHAAAQALVGGTPVAVVAGGADVIQHPAALAAQGAYQPGVQAAPPAALQATTPVPVAAPPAAPAGGRIILPAVPFAEKDTAKAQGARFNGKGEEPGVPLKVWFIPASAGKSPAQFPAHWGAYVG